MWPVHVLCPSPSWIQSAHSLEVNYGPISQSSFCCDPQRTTYSHQSLHIHHSTKSLEERHSQEMQADTQKTLTKELGDCQRVNPWLCKCPENQHGVELGTYMSYQCSYIQMEGRETLRPARPVHTMANNKENLSQSFQRVRNGTEVVPWPTHERACACACVRWSACVHMHTHKHTHCGIHMSVHMHIHHTHT